MESIALQRRLVTLTEEVFDEAVRVAIPDDVERAAQPDNAPRLERARALADYATRSPVVLARLLEALGGADPIARWVEHGVRRYGEVPLLGYGDRVKLTLDEVFVQLQVSGGFEVEEAAMRAPDRIEARGLQAVSPAEALQYAAKRGRRGVVMLGPPGSGKTTLLQHLFVRVARGEGEALGVPKNAIPVLLRFARITESPLVANGLRALVQAAAQESGYPDAATSLRGDGRPWLLLLDGLDEVRDEATRVNVCRWLEAELSHLPEPNAFVATCRNAAWQREARLGTHFLPLHVLDLDDASVASYVGRWFRAVERNRRAATDLDLADIDRDAEKRASDLLEVLRDPERRDRLRLGRLMYTPILLSTLCLVAHEDKELPRQRAELYERCLKLLLDAVTKPRSPTGHVSEHLLRPVFERIAWTMHHDDTQELSGDALERCVAEVLATVPSLALTPREFIAYGRDVCGLLVCPEPNRYRFFLLIFQEYLAACHARSGHKESVLAAHAGDPRWREVIALAVMQHGVFESFVAELLPLGMLGDEKVVALLRDCLHDVLTWDETPFVGALDRLLAARAAVVAWQATTSDVRLRRAVSSAPTVLREDVRTAASLLTLLRGHDRPGLRDRAECLAHDDDAGVRTAALAWLGRTQEEVEEPRTEPHTEPRTEPRTAPRAGPLTEPLTGLELLLVPAGHFLMGSSLKVEERGYDPEAFEHEAPARDVEVPDAFHIAQHPVTNAAYERFVRTAGVWKREAWRNAAEGDPQQPVTWVDWDDAMAFCAWLNVESPLAVQGYRFGLPSEIEWEYAARGPDGRRYPWGNDPPTPEHAVFGGAPLARVGEHPAGRSPFGLEDMAGNVWEWTANPGDEGEGARPRVLTDGALRVVRGGSQGNQARYLRCATRLRRHRGCRRENLGFRVVVRVSR